MIDKERFSEFNSLLEPINDEIIMLEKRIAVLKERKQRLISSYLNDKDL